MSCGSGRLTASANAALADAALLKHLMAHRLSDAQFQAAHRDHLRSAWWRAFRKEALAHYDYRCAVCAYGYQERGVSKWQLQIDHRAYWKRGELIFGRETVRDVRCLCPAHHARGVHADATIAARTARYRWRRVGFWVCRLPVRLVVFLLKAFWRWLLNPGLD